MLMLYMAIVHTDQESGGVPERGKDYLLQRVLQGVEQHPMEPHRAPLGGEGHATEAHESFHGDDTESLALFSGSPLCRVVRVRLPPCRGESGNMTTSPLLDEQMFPDINYANT